MAAISSTSNSDPLPTVRFSWPWGLMGAVAIVIAVEIALRFIGPMKLISFNGDESQYHAVREILDQQGAAEVALVGSSQMREGISMPAFMPELDRLAGRKVWAANYSVRGARADVNDVIVRYLKTQPVPPKVIVVGMSPRDLRAEAPDWPRVAIFWTPSDWWHEAHHHRADALAVLPVVVRTEVGRLLWSLRFRDEISLTLQRPFTRFGVDASEDPNPIFGEEIAMHVGGHGLVTFTSAGVPLHKLYDRVRDSYLAGRKTPVKEMLVRLQMLADDFKGAAPRGLWIEMANAAPLRQWLTELKLQQQYDTAVTKVLRGRNIRYVPASGQPAMLDGQFHDLQHLNRLGAELFSKWLAGEIAKELPQTATRH